MHNSKPLILIELNEINFALVKKYVDKGEPLPNFQRILETGLKNSESESRYSHLEPWIQWVSIHTGMTYEDHKVFRLGDIVTKNWVQIFEKVESLGFSVGAISPMNASNELSDAAYFIPDPWTKTISDKSISSRIITSVLRQTVNDNSSSKITFKSVIFLILIVIRYVKPSNYFELTRKVFRARGRPWRKALVLDFLLCEIHEAYYNMRRPDFSTLFLNAGAHIQHHFMLNSDVLELSIGNPSWYVSPHEDPMLEMLVEYDALIGRFVNNDRAEVLIVTGLSQVPFDTAQFYYRLKSHEDFLHSLNIDFKAVQPRMTRDFLISFNNAKQCLDAKCALEAIRINGQPMFGEIDNRGTELFVVLTYPEEIMEESLAVKDERSWRVYDDVVFVAIKNGQHDSTGYLWGSVGVSDLLPDNGAHVASIQSTILKYFEHS